jgi:hypothetical protein
VAFFVGAVGGLVGEWCLLCWTSGRCVVLIVFRVCYEDEEIRVRTCHWGRTSGGMMVLVFGGVDSGDGGNKGTALWY